jgi:hypothetical protein
MATMRYTQSATEMIPRMRFSIKSKFFAAAGVKHKRREKCDHNSDVNGIKHNHFQSGGAAANERGNATVLIWVNLTTADFAVQRLALPNADEVS